jgi:hypothetical protein
MPTRLHYYVAWWLGGVGQMIVVLMGSLLGLLVGGPLCVIYLDRELGRELGLAVARTLARVLGLDTDWHVRESHARARQKPRATDACEEPRARRVAPSAVGLLAAAAYLLPATDRARYAQEYRSELWDLAQSGAGRPRQLRYALSQLRRVVPMGFALRSPRRRGAAP